MRVCSAIKNAQLSRALADGADFILSPQIMPLNFRAKGVSLSTATNWAFNFLVGEVTPFFQEVIQWRLYPMHGFFCICSFVLG